MTSERPASTMTASRKPPLVTDLQIPPPRKISSAMARSSESSSSSTNSHGDRGFPVTRNNNSNTSGAAGVAVTSGGDGAGGGATVSSNATTTNAPAPTAGANPRASLSNPMFLQAKEKRPFTAGATKGGGGGMNLATALIRHSVNGFLTMSTPEGIIYSSRFDRDQRRELQLIPFPVRNERKRLERSMKVSERTQRRQLQELRKQASVAQMEQMRLEEQAALQRKRRCAKTFEEMIQVRVNACLSSPSTCVRSGNESVDAAATTITGASIQKLLDNGIVSSITLLSALQDTTIQTHCARAFYSLSRIALTRKTLITGNIVSTVKGLLRLANTRTKQDLAAILCHLTEETDLYLPSGQNFAMNYCEVMLQEGLERLLTRLFTTCTNAETKRISALAISNLSWDIMHVKRSVESFCQLLVQCTRSYVECVEANCFLVEAIYNVSLLAVFHATLLSENVPRFLIQLAPNVPKDHQVLILRTFCSFALTKMNRLQLMTETCLQFLSQMLQSDVPQVKKMASILLALLSMDESSRGKICSWLPSMILIVVARRHQPSTRPSSATAAIALSPSDCHAVEYPLSFVVRNLCCSAVNHQELVDNGIAQVLLQMAVSSDVEIKKNGISAVCSLANGLSPETLKQSIALITHELLALSVASNGEENSFVVRALYALSCNDQCLLCLVNPGCDGFALALHLAKLEEKCCSSPDPSLSPSPVQAVVPQRQLFNRSQQSPDRKSTGQQQQQQPQEPPWQSEVHCLVSAIIFRFSGVASARACMLSQGFLATLMQLVKHSTSAKSFAMNAIYLLAQDKDVFPNGRDEIAQLTRAMSDGKIIENAAAMYAKRRQRQRSNICATNPTAKATLSPPASAPRSSPRGATCRGTIRPRTASCVKPKTGSSPPGSPAATNRSPTYTDTNQTTATSHQIDEDEQTLRSGVTLLAHLATIPMNRSIMVRNGVFRFLRKLKYSTDENLLVNSAFVIYCMTTTQESAETLIKEDGLSLLIHLSRSSHLQVKELCMLAICRISSYMGLEQLLIENGIISAVMIMALVATDSTSIKVLCVKSLVNCLASKNCVKAMTDNGILWALTSLSMVDSHDAHLACAVAFCNLSSMPYMLARFYDAGAPKALLHLIQVSDDPAITLVAIKALANLVANENICTVLINEGVERLLKSHFEEVGNDDQENEKRQIVAMVLLRVTSAKDVINLETLKTGIFIWMQQIILMKQDELVRNCLLAVHELTSASSIHAAELEVDQVLKILMQVVARYEHAHKQQQQDLQQNSDSLSSSNEPTQASDLTTIDSVSAVETLKAMVALTPGSPTNSIMAAAKVNVRDEILSLCLWILYNLTCQVTFLSKLARPDILQFVRVSIPVVFDSVAAAASSPFARKSSVSQPQQAGSPAKARSPGDFKLCAMILHNLSCASLTCDESILASLVNLHAIAILNDIFFQREDLKEICAIAACNLIVGRVNSTRVLNENGALLLINFAFGDAFNKKHHLLLSVALRKLVNAPGNQQTMVDAGIVKAGVRILSLADVDLITCGNIMASFCLLSRTSRHLNRLLDDGLLPCVIRIAENKNTPHEILAYCFELLSNLCATDFEKHVTRPDINVVHCLAKLTDHAFPVTKPDTTQSRTISFYERGDSKALPMPSLITSMLRVSSTSLKKNLEMYGSYTVPTRKWLPEATPSPQIAPLPVCEEIPLLSQPNDGVPRGSTGASSSSCNIPAYFTSLFQQFEPMSKHALVRDESKEEEAVVRPIRFGSVANVIKYAVGSKRHHKTPKHSDEKEAGDEDKSAEEIEKGERNGKRSKGAASSRSRIRARTAMAMRKLSLVAPSSSSTKTAPLTSVLSHCHYGSTPNLFLSGTLVAGGSRHPRSFVEERKRANSGSHSLSFQTNDPTDDDDSDESGKREEPNDTKEDQEATGFDDEAEEEEDGEEDAQQMDEGNEGDEEEEEEEGAEEEEEEEEVRIPFTPSLQRPRTALR